MKINVFHKDTWLFISIALYVIVVIGLNVLDGWLVEIPESIRDWAPVLFLVFLILSRQWFMAFLDRYKDKLTNFFS